MIVGDGAWLGAGAKILDILLPGLGGCGILAAVLKDLRELRQGAFAPVVLGFRGHLLIDLDEIEFIRHFESLDADERLFVRWLELSLIELSDGFGALDIARIKFQESIADYHRMIETLSDGLRRIFYINEKNSGTL